ncbi:MAG: hypothetical protein H7A49_16045 [Akkermansiaceae bacterium]|nr:hypothetical protein [Akkermansiaceae bacterium]MCP5545407.1 hypothetical protein [Akkermansiaceae bacterium]
MKPFVPLLFIALPFLARISAEPAFLQPLRDDGFRFTPKVKEAWLAHSKQQALNEIRAAGKQLPDDFLAWIDADPVVRATVYGARKNPANVLLMLRSLELDLGTKAVREDFTQLALAMAVVHADKGPEADLRERDLLELVIPGDPRQRVDTRDPKRQLDRNDHIINFLESITIEEEVVVGHREEPPPLKYDDRGVAIPQPKNAKNVKVPVTETSTRTLYAADVIASRELQEKFNTYMKEHGEDVSIDCGDQVVHWKSTAAVRAERKAINDALVMFRTAYEEKGLLPKARDASPTPAESAAWWIRNDKFRFPPETAEQRAWPKYPLDSPWPTLTLLAADTQPLREREERWTAFRDKGEMRTYGEYIGPIAQQFDMQSARRITPYPFHYGTYQMMAKDGGVCGTMANMGVRTYNTLGMPSCTAGQPGHCALIRFDFDAKKNLYECKGGQFATGGPEKTTPHVPFVFSETTQRGPMIFYQTIAWAVNFGFQEYLDSTLAYRVFQSLPDEERAAHGLGLLENTLVLNPYNILLPEAAQEAAATPEDQIRFWRAFDKTLAAVDRPGCPKAGLYNQTVLAKCFGRIAKLPVPKDTRTARAVLDFLRGNGCDNAEALVTYQIALDGMDRAARETEAAFRKHLGAGRTPQTCALMAGTLKAVADRIENKNQRKQWAAERWEEIQGHENYLDPRDKILTDDCARILAKMNRAKLAAATELNEPVLVAVLDDFRRHVAGERSPKSCKQQAKRIGAVAKQLKDSAQAKAWLGGMAKAIDGRETYQTKNGKPQKDPAAETIARLMAAS